eukprot:CAMPEP_0118947434 /NCGR_PEP_ID=MMETSP1169-20130426/46007_1 /TAXON_ID=36882 /ORGANISM="Pyramimonas obovata, Strain CCMP722" /LENGTH=135 /DNA_ID=CAMNT_0006893643 /DNA_START=361 /DNA_END=764 /DNA_ORIENTATION=-
MPATVLPPGQSSAITTKSRIDIVSMKEKLLQDLGANAEEYWNLLKAFINVKLTKLEFDEQVPGVLGEANIHRHNEFIYAIIRNAHNAEPPTDVPPLKPRAKRERPDVAALLKQLEAAEDEAPLAPLSAAAADDSP